MDKDDVFIAAWSEALKLSRRGLWEQLVAPLVGRQYPRGAWGRAALTAVLFTDARAGRALRVSSLVRSPFTFKVPAAGASYLRHVSSVSLPTTLHSIPPPSFLWGVPPNAWSGRLPLLLMGLGCHMPLLGHLFSAPCFVCCIPSPQAQPGRLTVATVGSSASVGEHEADDVDRLLSHLLTSSSVVALLSSLHRLRPVLPSSSVAAAAATLPAATATLVLQDRICSAARPSPAGGSGEGSECCSKTIGRAAAAPVMSKILSDHTCVFSGEFWGTLVNPSSSL